MRRKDTLPKRKVTQPPKAEFRYPGRPLHELVKEYDQRASDEAWEGNTKEADRLQSIANEYRERLANGELYEVGH